MPPMDGKRVGRPRKSVRDEPTTDVILAAAEAQFAKAGFRGTSLSEIARASGIHAPSVLIYHFKSKQGLFVAVARRVCERGFSEIESASLATPIASERGHATLDRAIAFAKDHHQIVQRILAEALGEGPFGKEIDQPVSQIIDLLEQSLRESSDPPIPAEAPVREALANLVVAYYARFALADKLPNLWGEHDQTAEFLTAFLKTLRNWR